MIKPSQEISVEKVAAHYDDLDHFYRQVWGEHVHHGYWEQGNESPDLAVKKLARLVATDARIKAGDSVCDVGCGYGATAKLLASELGAQVTGFTVSPRQHAFAVKEHRTNSQLEFRLGDWASNGLESSSLDAVISIECLAHIADKQHFFNEVFRVLKPGRTMAITAWLSEEHPRPWQIAHLLNPICQEGRLCGMGTASEYRDMMETAGLEAVSYRSLRPQVRKTWSVCGRRVLTGLLTRRDFRKALSRLPASQWVFFLTIWRILIAYRVKAMDYGVFTARRPSVNGQVDS